MGCKRTRQYQAMQCEGAGCGIVFTYLPSKSSPARRFCSRQCRYQTVNRTRILKAFRSGIDICQLAKEYQVTRQRIHQILQKATGKKKLRELKPCLPLTDIMTAYKECKSTAEIAAWLSVNSQTLSMKIRELGITFQDRIRVRLFARFSVFVERYGAVPTSTVLFKQDRALQARLTYYQGGYRAFVKAWREYTKSTMPEEVPYTCYWGKTLHRKRRSTVASVTGQQVGV